MSKKTMTIQEFNDNYRISVLTEASMNAKLNAEGEHTLDYGSIETTHNNIDYVVYDDHNNEVMIASVTNDFAFLQELMNEFNITNLQL